MKVLPLSKQKLGTILPTKGLPATGYPCCTELEWLLGDSAEAYHTRGGHSLYGEHDIKYRMNSLGYRSPEFNVSAEIRVVVVGCSYVLGAGLPEEVLFHQRFVSRLRSETGRSAVVWNLGRNGTSNDYICRILYLAIKALNPNIVLINFTHIGRREYITADCMHLHYTPRLEPWDIFTRTLFGYFRALSSRHDDLLNFFKSYKFVEAHLKDRVWLFSTSDSSKIEPIIEHLDASRYCGELPALDAARDNIHPGPKSHGALFEKYWERFQLLGGLNCV